MVSLKVFLFLVQLHFSYQQLFRDDEIFSRFENRPRLFIHGGHMYFSAGTDKNITFRVQGKSSIYFGNLDLNTLPNYADFAEFRTTFTSLESNYEHTRQQVSRLYSDSRQTSEQLVSLSSTLSVVRVKLSVLETNNSITTNRLWGSLRRANRKLRQIKQLLQTDECSSNPCQHGGTCIDLHDKFFCLCPENYQGSTCSEDVNECQMYSDTTLGCQNSATCENTDGGFKCHCSPNHHGILCQTTHDDCNSGNMCGVGGTCITRKKTSTQSVQCEIQRFLSLWLGNCFLRN